MRTVPPLHRDDPGKDPLVGHVKVTREDWLNAARDVLVNAGVAQVKIAALATRLGVSRSSFYWYFSDRDKLLSALLQDWQTRNTRSIIDHCARPSRSIAQALCNFFRCFVDSSHFDPGLDFAIREWARRDKGVRDAIDAADTARLEAIRAMFDRHDYPNGEAEARARILYFMQLGYHALDLHEDIDTRMSRVAAYIDGFTGQTADPADIAEFITYVNGLNQ
ncbi:TetR/AcrR family transcriptional regulator [Rhodobacteraceae bacterium N5(2021)]|uniref:TetR/AcrR family transcriptional regulator n=1 Tax=Gymnodinialimonas phycosphaerae TaxID=2841589 RepID=A0A975TVF9_9RHOB|nr:TetR/AcrR family transcriptional regulator [Gymnodinialimonas phycosphaerae]MBY4891342.1 TetR/AcrR family transcriptional regulator [Gymnodinialimonas phycosphaerae]